MDKKIQPLAQAHHQSPPPPAINIESGWPQVRTNKKKTWNEITGSTSILNVGGKGGRGGRAILSGVAIFCPCTVPPKAKDKEKKGACEFTMETTNNEGTKQEKKLNLQTKGKKQEKKQREKKTNMGQQ